MTEHLHDQAGAHAAGDDVETAAPAPDVETADGPTPARVEDADGVEIPPGPDGLVVLDPIASEDRAEAEAADPSWPKPGEEGFVHPDGTPQSLAQLASNRQAAEDRARKGSAIHGAPLANPGPDPEVETAKAVDNAEKGTAQ